MHRRQRGSAVPIHTDLEELDLSVQIHTDNNTNHQLLQFSIELCTPITQSRSSCQLRSSYRNRLAVPLVKQSVGSRSFSVSGPTVWNALPDYLRSPTLSIDAFKRYLKTFIFAQY